MTQASLTYTIYSSDLHCYFGDDTKFLSQEYADRLEEALEDELGDRYEITVRVEHGVSGGSWLGSQHLPRNTVNSVTEIANRIFDAICEEIEE